MLLLKKDESANESISLVKKSSDELNQALWNTAQVLQALDASLVNGRERERETLPNKR
jgi:hypothetical protein